MESPLPLHIALLQPPYPAFFLGFSFLFGLLWGSFFNVCVYRLPMGLSPNRPRRSFCFSCGTPIAWFDNIPLLSWVILRGRCRHCGSRISFRYFAVEAVTGLLFALLWWSVNSPAQVLARDGFSLAVLWYWAVAGFLVIGALTDIDHWIIPDSITRGGLWTALAVALVFPLVAPHTIIATSGPFPAIRTAELSDPFQTVGAFLGTSPDRGRNAKVWGEPGRQGSEAEKSDSTRRPFLWWEPFVNAVVGAGVGYGLLWAIAVLGRLAFRREAMGGGDLKLFAFLGAVFGPFNVVVLLFLSSLVGVVLGVGTMLWSAIRPPRRVELRDLLGGLSIEEELLPATGEPSALGAGEAEKQAISETDSPDNETGSRNETEAEPRHRALEEYLIYARKRPVPRAVHHIPFGPSISLAALILLIYHEPIRHALAAYLLPAFGG